MEWKPCKGCAEVKNDAKGLPLIVYFAARTLALDMFVDHGAVDDGDKVDASIKVHSVAMTFLFDFAVVYSVSIHHHYVLYVVHLCFSTWCD